MFTKCVKILLQYHRNCNHHFIDSGHIMILNFKVMYLFKYPHSDMKYEDILTLRVDTFKIITVISIINFVMTVYEEYR